MFSRRVFLKNGGLALVSLGFAPAFLARTIEAAGHRAPQGPHHDLPARRGRRPEHDRPVRRARVLRGASEHRGAAARRGADGAVDLDGFFGLHPRLAPLKPLWDSQQLAIVHASGSPDGTRSHFDAQDYMETATPGVKSTQDGWLNRYLHAREHAERDAVPRRRARAAAAALAAGHGAGARHRADRPVRHSRRGRDMVQASFESEYAAAADTVLNGPAARRSTRSGC